MTISIVVKNVGEDAQVMEIDSSLQALQDIVGGHIEMVHFAGGVYLICNEEGKLEGLDPNFLCNGDIICGNACFVGIDEEGDTASLNEEEKEFLMDYLDI